MGKRFLRNVEKGAKFRKQVIKILQKYSKINPADCWMKPDLSIFKNKRLSI